jgi:hypothetical protein
MNGLKFFMILVFFLYRTSFASFVIISNHHHERTIYYQIVNIQQTRLSAPEALHPHSHALIFPAETEQYLKDSGTHQIFHLLIYPANSDGSIGYQASVQKTISRVSCQISYTEDAQVLSHHCTKNDDQHQRMNLYTP